jgi:glycosyltransferase involved in cell wall biosynthesis
LRLFACPATLPKPDQNSGDRRFFAILEMLGRRHQVDLWAPDVPQTRAAVQAGYDQRLREIGVNVLNLVGTSVANALASVEYDVGWFETYLWAEWGIDEFKGRQPRASCIVDSVDLHFLRASGAADLGVIPRADADDIRRRELEMFRKVDAVVAVSEAEAALLRHEFGIRHVFVIPNILPLRPCAPRSGRLPELLFVAGFAHPPNADGLMWFMHDIWPLIVAAAPAVSLRIVGSQAPPEVLELGNAPGVRVEGYVADIGPFLDRAAMSIAPLRYGGGMKGKVCEAMASGVPVVTTSVGIQGIPAVDGVDLLVADEPARFSDAVLSLLANPDRADAIGQSGRRLARLFTPEATQGLVHQVIDSVCAGQTR